MKKRIIVLMLALVLIAGCSEKIECKQAYVYTNQAGEDVVCYDADWWGPLRKLNECSDGNEYANPMNVKIIIDERCVKTD